MDSKKQKIVKEVKKINEFIVMLNKMEEESHPQDRNQYANNRDTTIQSRKR